MNAPTPASPSTTTATAPQSFVLEPPTVIAPVPVETARDAVPLKPELQKQVDGLDYFRLG